MNYTTYHPYKEREGGGKVKKFKDRERRKRERDGLQKTQEEK